MDLQHVFLTLLFLGLLAGILTGVPVMLVLLGVPLLVALAGSVVDVFDLSYLQAFPQRVFGLTGNTLLIAVPLFVCMGLLLERSRTAERMLLVMSRLMGGSAGSLAYAVLIVSTLIAASTGIIGATIVMLGLISLPAMTRAGLPLSLSSGLVCASGTLGQIIPPSIVLILLGDQIANTYLEAQHAAGNFAPDPVSVADLFAGALLPGLLLVGLYGLYVGVYLKLRGTTPLEARQQDPRPTLEHSLRPAGRNVTLEATVAGLDVAELELPEHPGATELLHIFLPPLLLMVSVLGSLLAGVATPTEAAAIGAAGALLLAASHQSGSRRVVVVNITSVVAILLLLLANGLLPHGIRGNDGASIFAAALASLLLVALLWSTVLLWRRSVLPDVLRETVLVSAMVFGIVLGASMLSLVFRGLGGDESIERVLGDLPGGDWATLWTVMLVVFLLGFVLEFVEIIFIVVPMVGPILLASDFDPVWIAVLLAINLQTSFLTPPFGFALFYFRSVAPDGMSTLAIYKAVIPFVVLQFVALCLVALIPQLATWLPARLM